MQQKASRINLYCSLYFQTLEKQVKDLQEERDYLMAEIKKYKDMTQNQMIELNQLKKENKELREELTDNKDLVRKLKVRPGAEWLLYVKVSPVRISLGQIYTGKFLYKSITD